MASIKYKIYKNKSSAGKKGMYYARAFHEETIGLEELAEHMSKHNTPYSKGTINGVLKDMVACIRELLLDSKKVKLDDLAIFSLGLTSKAANLPSEFYPSTHIVKAYINALGTGEISKKQLDITARFKEVGEYSRGGGNAEDTSGSDNTQTTPPTDETPTTPPTDTGNEGDGSSAGGSEYE